MVSHIAFKCYSFALHFGGQQHDTMESKGIAFLYILLGRNNILLYSVAPS